MAQSKRILIVDDYELSRESMREVLEMNGFIVEEADCGGAALAKVDEFNFDAILLDLKLPDMHGSVVARRMREELKLKLPIIAISGLTDEDQNATVWFDRMLNKPIDIEQLMAVLAAY